ncbi:YgaP family membrane protein [Vreelandella sulfidaeris]
MLPSTTSRVEQNTADSINQHIRRRTEDNIAYFAEHPHEIEQRLHELDHEWDIERTLEANAATLSLAGVALGALVDKRWLLLPAAVTGFLLQHALQGWCPPIIIFRKRGVRTSKEIDQERYALKALRGDFSHLVSTPPASPRDRMYEVLDRVER